MKKILILEANPQRDLKLNEEIRDLQNVIERSQSAQKFEIKISPALRSSDLQESILRFQPNIIHFCGHGTGKEGLVLMDKKLYTSGLSDLFELFKEHLECVVLNACYSEVQADEIVKHIKYVIGMNQAIRDDAAIAFSMGFYRALGYGRSFEDAFKFGKNAIQLAIGDGSTNRDVIAENVRKLVPIDYVSETVIVQEHLQPVLKINSDLPSIKARVDLEQKSTGNLILAPRETQEREQQRESDIEANITLEKNSQLSSTLTSEQYCCVEEILKELIGPIASHLIQKFKVRPLTLEELVEKLTVYLSLSQITEFEHQVTPLFHKFSAHINSLNERHALDECILV